MSKMFKCMCLLVMSVFCMSSFFNPDGSVDTILNDVDGVYISMGLYIAYIKRMIDLYIYLRSYDPNVWNYVNTLYGNKNKHTHSNFITVVLVRVMILVG